MIIFTYKSHNQEETSLNSVIHVLFTSSKFGRIVHDMFSAFTHHFLYLSSASNYFLPWFVLSLIVPILSLKQIRYTFHFCNLPHICFPCTPFCRFCCQEKRTTRWNYSGRTIEFRQLRRNIIIVNLFCFRIAVKKLSK